MNKLYKSITKAVSKKSPELIKILVVAVVALYYSFFIFSCIYWLNEQRYISELLEYISNPFLIVVSSYLVISAINNSKNIKKNYDKTRYRKYTFTLLLVLLIIFFFFVAIIFFSVCWIFLYQCPVDLVEYIVRPFLIIFPTFVAKTVLEKKFLDDVSIMDIASTLTDIATGGINSSTTMSITSILSSIAKFNNIKKKKTNDESNKIIDQELDPDTEFNIDILTDDEIDSIFSDYIVKDEDDNNEP